MFRGDAQHAGIVRTPITLPLSLSWRYVTNRPLTGVNPTSPILAQNVGNSARGFFAARDLIISFLPQSGETSWFYPSTGGSLGQSGITTVRTTPLYHNGMVYIGASDGHLYAIRAATGNFAWEYPSGSSSITASPISVNNQLFFGTSNGSIVGLDATTGKPLGEIPELFRADDAIVGSLTYADGFLYFVSRDQNAYALDVTRALAPQQGRRPKRVIRWRYTMAAPPAYSTPVIHNDMIYLVDGENLLALTSSRGRQRWSFPAGATISDTPAVTEQGIFFGTRQGNFFALNLDGRERWRTEIAGPAYSSPIVAPVIAPTLNGGRSRYAVFVGSNRGFVYAFDTGADLTNPANGTAAALSTNARSATRRPGRATTLADTPPADAAPAVPANGGGGTPLWIYRVRPADPAQPTVMNVAATPVIANNQLFILADDGSLLGFTAGAPDVMPPLVWGEMPDRAILISGRPPINYLVNVSDDGSGINPNTIVMRVDGQAVDYTYDEYRGLIYYRVASAKPGSREVVQPLPTGRHNVRLEVADWKANKTVREWSFVVDNSVTDRPILRAPDTSASSATSGAR